MKSFPPDGEYNTWEKDENEQDFLVKYRLRFGVLKNYIFKFDDSDL